ncbi:MAG: DUF456 family protein [Bythopirellula sp.]
MDYFLLITAISLLVLAIIAGWGLTLMGLPGNWLMVGAAALYAGFAPATGVTSLSWTTLAVMAALAAAGEVAEFGAGVWGARRAGGSRRAAIFSLIGSMVGALMGATLGLPIPLLGPPLAAVLGGATGALAGAALAERTRGETSGQSLRVGGAAFVGRLLGTGAKTLVATILAVLAIVALIV